MTETESEEDFQFGDEGDDFIGEDDLFIERDENGELRPAVKEIPQLGGKAKVLPMAYGKVQRLFIDVDEDEISGDVIAEVLREQVIKPDLSEMTEEEMAEQMKPMAPQFLFMAVLEASGVSGSMGVTDDGDAQFDLEVGN